MLASPWVSPRGCAVAKPRKLRERRDHSRLQRRLHNHTTPSQDICSAGDNNFVLEFPALLAQINKKSGGTGREHFARRLLLGLLRQHG